MALEIAEADEKKKLENHNSSSEEDPHDEPVIDMAYKTS